MTILALLLIAFGGLIAVLNWWTIFWTYHTKRFHSVVPLVGAVLLGTGMFMLNATRWYCWTALLLDFGTLALLLALPRIFREAWETSRCNLLSEYIAQSEIETARLFLFRRRVFTIRLEVDRPPGECGIASLGTIGEWERNGEQLILTVGKESAVFSDVEGAAIRQFSGFPSWEKDQDTSLADLHFVQTKSGAG